MAAEVEDFWQPNWHTRLQLDEELLPEERVVWHKLLESAQFSVAPFKIPEWTAGLAVRGWPWILLGMKIAASAGIGPPDDLVREVPTGETFIKSLTQMRAPIIVQSRAIELDLINVVLEQLIPGYGLLTGTSRRWMTNKTLCLLYLVDHADSHHGSRFLTQLRWLQMWKNVTGMEADPIMSQLVCNTADPSLRYLGTRATLMFGLDTSYVRHMVTPLEQLDEWEIAPSAWGLRE